MFFVVVGTVYLATIVGAFFAFHWGAHRISDEFVERFALAQNELERNRILSLVERELVLSRKLADDPQVRDWILNEEDPDLRDRAERQIDSYHRFLGYGTVFIAIESSGRYYVTGGDSSTMMETVLERDNPLDRWFFDTLERDGDHEMNVNYDAVLDEVRVWINVIVRDAEGRRIGVAGSGIDLTDFLENLVDRNEPGIQTVIVNSAGELQAHPDRSLIEHNARVDDHADKITIFDLVPDAESGKALGAAIDAKPQQARLFPLNLNGQTAMTALGYLPALDWHHLVLVDAGSIIGPVDFLPLGLVFLASLLTVLIGLFLLFNRFILEPLSRLTQAAEHVAEGAYHTRLPETADNEIGTLSASFNAMTAKLRDYTANLESMVAHRTEALAAANQDLTESQQRLTDSIQYARLIQQSIIPSSAELNRFMAEHFLIREPVDLVGGDFPFCRETPDGFCIAAVDCTGHGVPGAFMTMMVNALLNRITETDPHGQPAAILDALHRLVQETLRGGGSQLENGLDIAFCRVDLRRQTLDFAGAGLPLFVMEGENVREIRGERRRVGFSNFRATRRSPRTSGKTPDPSTQHRIPLNDRQRFYLISDGVLDLPGGEHGFGFGRRRLKDLLSRIAGLPMEQQKLRIRDELRAYQGDHPQRDDMLFCGFRIVSSELQ